MKLGLYLFLVAGVSLSWHSWAGAAIEEVRPASDVQRLIDQLGDRQYLIRQRAETLLLERGAEVFAELKAAENHTDLEIAKRAKYLLNQIRIEWVRSTDAAIVRSILARYGELSQVSREAKVDRLALLEDEQGFGALCRIVRFDASARIVRYAALKILEKGFVPAQRTAAAVTMLTAEMGEAEQVPLNWIRIYVDQLQTPEQIDSRWFEVIDAEIQLLADESDESSEAMIVDLLRCHLELCAKLSEAEAIFANWQRSFDLSSGKNGETEQKLIEALTWTLDQKQWSALELFEDHYTELIRSNRFLLYVVAASRDKQGRPGDAQELAERAFYLEIKSDNPSEAIGDQAGDEDQEQLAENIALERNQMADHLRSSLGRHDWAEREWRRVIETMHATNIQSLWARRMLASFRLHDRGECRAAAELLTVSLEAIKSDATQKNKDPDDRRLLGLLRSLQSNREFYLACYQEGQADFEKQRQHLERAYRLEKENADILIAMFHSKEADAAYRQDTRKRLETSKSRLETYIKKLLSVKQRSPKMLELPDLLAEKYNHWAWLVSNTEGDFAKAVEYSKRSLEIKPEDPGYMDTLGRCYYSAGDLENAAKVQRRAVALHPHLMVMQRQLKQFEDELQKRQEADAGE